MQLPQTNVSLLLVIVGPAGSGKSTLCERLVREEDKVERVVTCTTRSPRDGEVNGVDYHFLSSEEFEAKILADEFLEHARVHTNRYGVLKQSIREKLDAEIDIVMNIDVQGVANLRAAASTDQDLSKRLVTIFILPPSLDVVRERLQLRGQDDEAEIERRIETAEKEVKLWPEFDYVILTKTKDEDYRALHAIVEAEKRRASRLLG